MVIALFLTALGLVVALTAPPVFAADKSVVIAGKGSTEFSPQEIWIGTGDRVEWENRDGSQHAIVLQKPFKKAGEAFDTMEINAVIPPNEKMDHQFRQTGQYPYFCGIHPDMWGMVVVE